MGLFTGNTFQFTGSSAAGNFYTLYKKLMGCHRESRWLRGGLFFRVLDALLLRGCLFLSSFACHKVTLAVDGRQRLYKFEPSRFQKQYMRINAR